MARYNRWMNLKLYALAAPLEDAERKRELGAFFGSLHGTLNHLLLGDRVWMRRFTGDRERYASRDVHGEPLAIRSLAQELYADFDQLRREREQTDEDILAWTYSLDEAALDRPLEYETIAGEPQRHAAWWAIGHFFNHQTHHRGQATSLLKQLGIDPGVTDLLAMMRVENPPAR